MLVLLQQSRGAEGAESTAGDSYESEGHIARDSVQAVGAEPRQEPVQERSDGAPGELRHSPDGVSRSTDQQFLVSDLLNAKFVWK